MYISMYITESWPFTKLLIDRCQQPMSLIFHFRQFKLTENVNEDRGQNRTQDHCSHLSIVGKDN